MIRLFLTDLDDTLFQSLKKCPPDTRLTPAARTHDNSWHSFMTPKQLAFYQWLSADAQMVPVTARSRAALSRVALPFIYGAIVQHGGMVLTPELLPDPLWLEWLAPRLGPYQPKLLALAARLERDLSAWPELKVTIYQEDGWVFYIGVKNRDKTMWSLGAGEQAAMALGNEPGMWQHLNGNNLAILPDTVRKELAVSWFLERLRAQYPELCCIGAGDSISDLPFLRLCDYALLPTQSQAVKHVFNHA
jgi:hypothetical protein